MRKSYFSKAAISSIIEESIEYIYTINKENPNFIRPTKENIGLYLISKDKINEAIYDTFTEKNRDFGDCNAMVKKRKCGNPITKVGCEFCVLHTNNPPDMTWSDYQRMEKITKKSEV